MTCWKIGEDALFSIVDPGAKGSRENRRGSRIEPWGTPHVREADMNIRYIPKESPLFSRVKDALQIQLFCDDFETSNVLGSKMGLQKLDTL